jgi:hypothetical protein
MGSLPETEHIEDTGNDFELVPSGKYRCIIESSEIKSTKNENGTMLSYVAVIIDGDHEGRKIFGNMMLRHENEKAEQIGLQQLKKLKAAIGKPQSTQEEDLWETPFLAKIGVEKGKNGYEDRNRIQDFAPDGASAPKVAPVKTATPPPGEGTPKRSWRK